jgi:hypothetical protein
MLGFPRKPARVINAYRMTVFRQRPRALREEPQPVGGVFQTPRQQPKETIMLKYVLPLALLVSATAPALAAEFYIVRGSDQKCKIVETRPTDKTVTVIGDKAYVTRAEADRQMAVVCKTN